MRGHRGQPSDYVDQPENLEALPEGLQLVDDLSAAEWLVERVAKRWGVEGVPLSAIVPAGFETYLRLLHPSEVRDGQEDRKVSWAEVASIKGKTVHAHAVFESIAGGEAGKPWAELEWPYPPHAPNPEMAERLVSLLRGFTTTPDKCWFGIWHGYSGMLYPEKHPRFQVPNREYNLFSGPLSVVNRFFIDRFWQPPSLWWPDDRAWVVGSEIDLYSTYVGGTKTMASALLNEGGFEAFEVSIDSRVDIGQETINW